ncbi:MAG: single-stranded-DNA-specific exonuclease RecJ [bacterium]
MNKKWKVANLITEDFKNCFPQLNALVLQLLFNRGLKTQKEIDEFLNPDYSSDLYDPFLFEDMEKAVAQIFKAIKNNENIVVFGDYDADGVTGSVVLIKALEFLGAKNVRVFIPHREKEGYGLNKNSVNELHKGGCNLMITTDCGISNFEEVKFAKELGMDVIVTDHHHAPKELPNAIAIINPKVPGSKYPFDQLAGVGVAFKMVQALLIGTLPLTPLCRHTPLPLSRGETTTNPPPPPSAPIGGGGPSAGGGDVETFHPTIPSAGGYVGAQSNEIFLAEYSKKKEAFEKWLLDLVAIGTITDCCPLVGENRTLVKYGLVVLNKTRRVGLRRLIEDAGFDFSGKRHLTTYNIGFQIGPRINAAGRIDHATSAFELLIEDDLENAAKLSANLNQTNKQRQLETENIFKEAKKQAMDQKDDDLIITCGKGWMIGVVGLVASKLVQEFNRPALVMGESEDGVITGSARSIPQFNMIEALEKIPEFLVRFGGHSQAAGFTLKNKESLEEFQARLKKMAKEKLSGIDLSPVLEIDAETKLADINWELFENIEKLEPFGEANCEPLFLIKEVEVVEIRGVGQDEKHLRLRVKQGNKFFTVIGFSFGNTNNGTENWGKKLNIGDVVDLVAYVSVNEWNGNRELQLKLEDIAISI